MTTINLPNPVIPPASVSVTYVHNLNQTVTTGYDITSTFWFASNFTTGNTPQLVDTVTLVTGQRTAGTINIRIYADALFGQAPVASFITPTIRGTAVYTFTLTNNVLLSANRLYYIVGEAPTGSTAEIFWATASSNAEVGLDGWTIGDSSLVSSNQGGTWSTLNVVFTFAINCRITTATPPRPIYTMSLAPSIIIRNGNGVVPATPPNNGTQLGTSFTLKGGGTLVVTMNFSIYATSAVGCSLSFLIATAVDATALVANSGSRIITIFINQINHFTFPTIRYTVTNYTAGTYFGYALISSTASLAADQYDPWVFMIKEVL